MERPVFDVILHNNAVWYVFNLLVAFLFTTDFKSVIADSEIF